MPMVAATAVVRHAGTATSAITSFSRSSEGLKPEIRESAHAPSTGSRVFPTAIPRATGTGAPTQTFTKKAPSATPGQSPRP